MACIVYYIAASWLVPCARHTLGSQMMPTFGYVLQTVPSGFAPEVMSNPTLATQALMDANEQAIQAARPCFDTMWIEDHLQWDQRPVLEDITALSYLAGRHEGMRLGHIVLCQSFRNPALLAKQAATLQALSRGNFILGIGAGWKDDEYLAYGYPYPPDGERVDQLEEAVQVIRAMWTQSPATFLGRHYRIDNAECHPQPEPSIPILIGGGGEKKTLSVVARHADWWTAPISDLEEYAHKQRVLAEHCQQVGRNPQSITHTFCARVSLHNQASEFERRPGRYIVGGTADMVTKELETLVSMGVKHFQLSFMDFPRLDGLHLFNTQVWPRLQG